GSVGGVGSNPGPYPALDREQPVQSGSNSFFAGRLLPASELYVMPKRKKDFDFLQMFAESDPESAKAVYEISGMTPAELVREIREDYATGRSRHQPWRWDQCRSWLDAWLYLYRRVQLDYHQHMFWRVRGQNA